MNVWFTSDLHFGHDKPFVYEPRGFSNIWDMNEAIIKNWNSVVNIEDEVYILGDLMLNNNENGLKCIKQLKGRLHIVLGNHDTTTRRELYKGLYNVENICEAESVKIAGHRFFLCHYPVLCSNYDDNDRPLSKRLISLCGHTHTTNPFQDWDKGMIYHVELDAHNCTPVLVDDIIEDINERIKNGN